MKVLQKVFSQQTFLVFQDTLKTSSRKLQRNNMLSSQTSSRCLQDGFARRLQDDFVRRLQNIFQDVFRRCLSSTSWRRLEDVYKTFLKTKIITLKTSSTRLHQDECFLGYTHFSTNTLLKIGSKCSHEFWRINHSGNCPELCFDKSCSTKISTSFTRTQLQMNSFLVKMSTKACNFTNERSQLQLFPW